MIRLGFRGLVCCLLLLCPLTAHVQTRPARTFFDAGAERQARVEASLRQAIEGALLAMPGIERVRVQVFLKDTRLLSTAPRSDSAAVVMIWISPTGTVATADQVREVVRAALPDLKDDHLTLQWFNTPAEVPATGQFLRALGAPESRTLIIALLALSMLLSLGWIRAGMQMRKLRRNSGSSSDHS
jgi:type III secretory pathway lipoprotein EscJ